MAKLLLSAVLGRNSSCVTTTDDNDGAVLGGINSSIQSLLGTVGEGFHLEDTRRTVPEDGLGLGNGLLVQLDTLVANIQAHVAVGNALLVGGIACLGVGGELIRRDVVDRQDNLDVVLLGLLDDVADGLAASLVEQTVTDLDVLQGLLEGEGHATGDDQAVDLGQQVVDQLDLVGDLGTTKDGQERARGALKSLGEVLELLLHEEARGLLGQVNTDHRAVGTVGSSERIIWNKSLASSSSRPNTNPILTDVDVTQGSQALAELGNLLLVGLDLLALLVLVATFLLGVETQVLKQNDLTARGLVDGLLHLLANTVLSEDDALAEQLLQLRDNRLQAVLGVLLAIGTAKVGHEDDGLGTLLDGIFDGGQSTNDTLGVGDLLLLIERDVEVDLPGTGDMLAIARLKHGSLPEVNRQLAHGCGFSTTYPDQDTLVL